MDSLRVTLQKLEQDPASDGRDVAELKQILLNRIAELEALQALNPTEEVEPAPAPSDLPSIAATAAEEPARDAANATGIEKLN
ncbi:MAG TPA: hypothetical protein VK574_08755 [Terracidiphilus sp.]|nr:hypothetical protein [Terracidiphilus sp.]